MRDLLAVSLSICCSSPSETERWTRSALHLIQEIHMFGVDFYFFFNPICSNNEFMWIFSQETDFIQDSQLKADS